MTDIHTRKQTYTESLIFEGGSEGYHSYRIPSIIRSKNLTLLAFSEGRKDHAHDYGDIDIVYKRSTDHGATWGPLQVLVAMDGTCGNATPVVDMDTGIVWLFLSFNPPGVSQFGKEEGFRIVEHGDRMIFLVHSNDNGQSWSNPVDLTGTLLPDSYDWDAVGPGNGIQCQFGPNVGRLIVPALHRNIISDDHGETWYSQPLPTGTSESTIVECLDGSLIRNDRASLGFKKFKRRIVANSMDGGSTWSDFKEHPELNCPHCQGAILRYNDSAPARLIFSNPDNTESRKNMSIKISYDNGLTWPISRTISGQGGYSSLAKSDFQVAMLNEIGNTGGGHQSIIFRKFNLPWILNGNPEPI